MYFAEHIIYGPLFPSRCPLREGSEFEIGWLRDADGNPVDGIGLIEYIVPEGSD